MREALQRFRRYSQVPDNRSNPDTTCRSLFHVCSRAYWNSRLLNEPSRSSPDVNLSFRLPLKRVLLWPDVTQHTTVCHDHNGVEDKVRTWAAELWWGIVVDSLAREAYKNMVGRAKGKFWLRCPALSISRGGRAAGG
jgi:hypothetical protein